MQRVLSVYKDTIWLNPQPESVWDYHESIRVRASSSASACFR
jgi:uncharacterized protein with von Willebrand factor type A (vWA) domain